MDSCASLLYFRSPSRLSSMEAYFTTSPPNRLNRLYHQPAHTILLCQCFPHIGGTGISTCCPSPTTIVLGLGPDLPWADEPSPGNLGLSTCMFLACISLLIPAFSLLCRPQLLTVLLQPTYYAPLPLAGTIIAFVIVAFLPLRIHLANSFCSQLLKFADLYLSLLSPTIQTQ